MSNFSMNPGSNNANQPPPPPPPPSPCTPAGGNGALGCPPARPRQRSGGRRHNHGALQRKIQQMALPLAPLVQLRSGRAHPAFPPTLLHFWLLTGAQLDELAAFYHQRWPGPLTQHYPCPVAWAEDLSLEEKRRKIGKFIGLRGCDTPVHMRTEEQIIEAARRARSREDDDEALRRKAAGFY